MILERAKNFINQAESWLVAHDSNYDIINRMEQIALEIQTTGTYTHNSLELEIGAKLAWFNSNRCIGRHLWRSLNVFDCRKQISKTQVVSQLKNHLEFATNGGDIRSSVSIFAPRKPNTVDPVRIGNHQLIRYAGFREVNLGDPDSYSFTDFVRSKGWRSDPKDFAFLPWLIRIDGNWTKPVDLSFLPDQYKLEVSLTHPECDGIADLNLRWYAVPVVSDMALEIGGIVYPCAPFNGWYMGTEIGARNLADKERWNVLPKVANKLSLDVRNERNLWRDKAMVELNRAILHSFDKSSIRIGDHHQLTTQFDRFCESESKKGKTITGDWQWLVPPLSGSISPQFHRHYQDDVKSPNFFYQNSPWDNERPKLQSDHDCKYYLSNNI